MLQDEVMFCIQQIGDVQFVLGMDVLAFQGLYESCERVYCRLTVERAKLEIATSQGTEENVNERLEPYQEKLLVRMGKPKVQDAAAFLEMASGGI